jgi:hypothetical protein
MVKIFKFIRFKFISFKISNSSFITGMNNRVKQVKNAIRLSKTQASHINNDEKNKVAPINSFGNIFNQDQDQIKGIQRVFRKSIILLSLSLISFVLFAFVTNHLFSFPIGLTIIFFITYITSSIIFFLIVADRSYVWLSLLAHLFAILITSSFVGALASPITWSIIVVIAILYYLAYSELEKSQLGSRLFSIHQITGEATNLLISITLITMSLGVFSSIQHQGTVSFIKKDILENPVIFREVVIGNGRAINLNRFFEIQSFESYEGDLTLEQFLIDHYRDGTKVINSSEELDIKLDCEQTNGTEGICGDSVLIERKKRLTEYLSRDFPEISYTLDKILDKENYEQIVKQLYINKATKFVDSDNQKNNESKFELEEAIGFSTTNFIINKNAILPAVIAVFLFVICSLLRPILTWLSLIVSWIVWQILKIIKFVRIDIETVESEVVSI